VEGRVRIGVLADDLIWASRLAAAVESAGGEPIRATTHDGLVNALRDVPPLSALIVDLAVRRLDPLEGIRLAGDHAVPALAVGQHEDLELRDRAIAAGAERWVSYNAFHRRGPGIVAALLGERVA
jgi:hypothetical protein